MPMLILLAVHFAPASLKDGDKCHGISLNNVNTNCQLVRFLVLALSLWGQLWAQTAKGVPKRGLPRLKINPRELQEAFSSLISDILYRIYLDLRWE